MVSVLFDNECPMCVSQMRLLRRLDWRNTLDLIPLRDARAQELAPQLDREQLLAAMHCVTKNGGIYRGARCIRFIGMRVPLLVPLALLLWLPGMIWIADKIYDRIARNRLLLSRAFGCADACAVNPTRKREQGKAR